MISMITVARTFFARALVRPSLRRYRTTSSRSSKNDRYNNKDKFNNNAQAQEMRPPQRENQLQNFLFKYFLDRKIKRKCSHFGISGNAYQSSVSAYISSILEDNTSGMKTDEYEYEEDSGYETDENDFQENYHDDSLDSTVMNDISRKRLMFEQLQESNTVERTVLSSFLKFVLDTAKKTSEDLKPGKSLDINTENILKILGELHSSADLSDPPLWHPLARNAKRSIIMHVGPTNSGKTYHALKRLRESKSGIFCGPLRLLAHEVFDRMNNEWNVPCKLITGEEQREPPNYTSRNPCLHVSSTVEMADLKSQLEVAVIDEIQMIADPARGWAWTDALLGVQAREIHLCGEETAVDLVQRIVECTGDSLEIKRYERLTPLKVSSIALQGGWSGIMPGDCVVAFSRKLIFELKQKIELETGLRCAVVYGTLPPETRSEQGRLFNDPESQYEVLVASDAVGMGLNLSIKRIVFYDINKFDGKEVQVLTVSQAKQIAGRAGRFATYTPTKIGLPGTTSVTTLEPVAKKHGIVTTFREQDLQYIRDCIETSFADIGHIPAAGLAPNLMVLEKFGQILPKLSLVDLLGRFQDIASIGGNYFLCNLESQLELAQLINDVPLSLADKFMMVRAPVRYREESESQSFMELATVRKVMSQMNNREEVAKGADRRIERLLKSRSYSLLDLKVFRELQKDISSDQTMNLLNELPTAEERQAFLKSIWTEPKDPKSLQSYETLHRITTGYLWLHYRFQDTFGNVEVAREIKSHLENVIQGGLLSFSHVKFHQPKVKRNLGDAGKLTAPEAQELEELRNTLIKMSQRMDNKQNPKRY